ncbi:phage tail assembly chaperone [Novosphingobium sp. JCM 18896]|uniref:phage tail assembly chaperone n=1 Tax=Novosphingobium sp. JCM 18896 TaxID=2989731 RepID=UPI002221372E|nr:phage tail assembly chaperone [Novosphingobium sp. JCM 18896]MCW1429151.1 phage tail assembly chaperone [Novosphingobium sp. JCM 18896]
MSESFAAAALRLYALAARLLGWRPPEFWAATPAELAAVLNPQGEVGLDRAALAQMMERIDGRSG